MLVFATHFREYVKSQEASDKIEIEAQQQGDVAKTSRSAPINQAKSLGSVPVVASTSAPEQLIDFEAEPRIWTPPQKVDGSTYHLPQRALTRIGQLTGSLVDYDTKQSHYIVKAVYDHDIEEAIHKMEAISTTEVCPGRPETI